MDITPELKQRFATDCCIPIDIFTEPVFTSRIELFDRFYNSMERYNVFVDMIRERYTSYEMESKTTVTGNRKGSCNITAQSRSNPEISKTCAVNVVDRSDGDKVESISLDQTELYLAVGSSRQLTASLLPETLEDKWVLWGSSDRTYATVQGGKVTAIMKTPLDTPCVITAMSNKDKTKTATCNVYITDPTPLSGLDFEYHQTYLEIGSVERLKIHAVPTSATSPGFNWLSSDPDVAEINSGILTAKQSGDCSIAAYVPRAEGEDGIDPLTKIKCTRPTGSPATRFLYDPDDIVDSVALNNVFLHDTGGVIDVTKVTAWSEDYTFDSAATERAQYYILTSLSDRHTIKDFCHVLVSNIIPVSQIILSQTNIEMMVGGLVQLSVTIEPERATNKEVVWTVSPSNDTILKIDDPSTGLIRAVGRGSATIRATSVRDTSKYADCVVNVVPSLFVRSIEIDPTEKSVDKGKTFEITAVVSVGHGVDPSVDWISQYEKIATATNDDSSQATQKSMTIHAQDYYNDYDQVKSRIIQYIKGRPKYSEFNRADVSSWTGGSGYVSGSLYTPEMDGHTVISIGWERPLFDPLYCYSSTIFENMTWENVVSTKGETDNDHIIYCENLLNEVVANCNVSRIQAYGRHLLGKFYTDKVKSLISALGVDSHNQPMASIVYFGPDELVIDTSKLTRITDLDTSSDVVVCTNRLLQLYRDINDKATSNACHFKVRLSTLYKLKTEYTDDSGNTIVDSTQIDGYVRNIYFEGNQPLHFHGYDPCQLPILVRSMSYQSIQDDDRKFMHQGLVAQFTDDRKIHVPKITSVPDTPRETS